MLVVVLLMMAEPWLMTTRGQHDIVEEHVREVSRQRQRAIRTDGVVGVGHHDDAIKITNHDT